MKSFLFEFVRKHDLWADRLVLGLALAPYAGPTGMKLPLPIG